MRIADIFFQALTWPPEVTTEHYGQSNKKFWHLKRLGTGSASNYTNISSDDTWNVSGTTPEPFREIHQNLIPEPFRNHSGKFTKI